MELAKRSRNSPSVNRDCNYKQKIFLFIIKGSDTERFT